MPEPGYWAQPGRFWEMVEALGSDDPGRRRSATAAAVAKLGGPPSEHHAETTIVLALREFPDELAAKIGVLHEYVKGSLAANPHAPEWVLRRLASDPDGTANHTLAQNPACPADILAELSADPDQLTRAWVAANPSTPLEVLAGMVDGAEGKVSQALARRAELPPETRGRLGESMPGGNWPCRVCGGPGGAVVVVAAEPGFRSGRPIPHPDFVRLFPDVVASWCADHAGDRWRGGAYSTSPPPADGGAPEADRLPERLEMFWRRSPNTAFTRPAQVAAEARLAAAVNQAVGSEGWAARMADPYNTWAWVHVGRSLEWWLAGQGRIRCGQEGWSLSGGWSCDEPASAVLGDRRWGGDWAVCARHAGDPPRELRWAGCHVEWDAERDCWKRTAGTVVVRPELWDPGH